jgi:hypothetical protein
VVVLLHADNFSPPPVGKRLSAPNPAAHDVVELHAGRVHVVDDPAAPQTVFLRHFCLLQQTLSANPVRYGDPASMGGKSIGSTQRSSNRPRIISQGEIVKEIRRYRLHSRVPKSAYQAKAESERRYDLGILRDSG